MDDYSRQLWHTPPNTADAYTALANLYLKEQPLEAQRLCLRAIGLAPNYHRTPYWTYAQLLETQSGPNAYTCQLKVRQLELIESYPGQMLPEALLYRRALEVAEACWIYRNDAQAAKRYYRMAHRLTHRQPKRLRRLFYQLFQHKLYEVVFDLCKTLKKEYRYALAYPAAHPAHVYYESKALELKIQYLLTEYRDYWQAHRLVKRWRKLQPYSKAAQAYEQQIKTAHTYL